MLKFGLQVFYTKLSGKKKFGALNQGFSPILGSKKVIDSSALITQRISSAYSKFNELKHVLTDKRIHLNTRVKFLTACVRSRLTFSVQACLLTAAETTKLKTVWMNFLRKLVRRGFQRVNVPPEARRRGSRRLRRSNRSTRSENDPEVENNEDLDWRYILTNEEVLRITNSAPIPNFCQIQHLKYIGHVTRLPNSALQKQVLFRTNRKRYSRDPWRKYETITNLDRGQLQREMQDKTRFPSLLETIFNDTQPAEQAEWGRR